MSIAIIIIITSMVLLRYDKFDSTVLLKNAAYDIALTLREAQIKSVSAVKGSATEEKYPYGVTFTPGLVPGKEYVVFRFGDNVAYPYYAITGNEHTSIDPTPPSVTDTLTTTIDRTMYVSDVCVETTTDNLCHSTSDIKRLDISFRRPESRALFFAPDFTGPDYVATSTIQSATIKLASPKGTEVFLVKVSQLGQITVKKQ